MVRVLIVLSWLFSSIISFSQNRTLELSLKNELSGKPVDATVTGSGNENVRRIAPGVYQITAPPDSESTISITRDGYFDTDLLISKLSAGRTNEIKLKPGVPQLNITVVSEETGEVITSAIDLFTMDESSIVFSDEVEIAPYTIDLEYNEVHVLQVRKDGFFSFKDTIDFKNVFDGRSRKREIRLVPIKEGNKISLQNIYFKPNEWELTSFAKLMLDELTHVLEREKTVSIEIGAHTDDVGTNEYNQTLSEKRAMSVKKYLIEKGAKVDQLLARGYGESTPLMPNDSDQNRAMNRRVEFKILKVK